MNFYEGTKTDGLCDKGFWTVIVQAKTPSEARQKIAKHVVNLGKNPINIKIRALSVEDGIIFSDVELIK
jgi:hypothetical protein